MKHTLKDNPRVYKVIITGILCNALPELFSVLNSANLDVTEKDFSEFYGFTVEDMNDLLKTCLDYSSKGFAEQFNDISSWYNGYNIGGLTIYNPFSIMNCLSCARRNPHDCLKPYWVDSGRTDVILE